jgi:hypothetical protein
LSAILVRGSGLLSVILIFLTCEQIQKSLEYTVDQSPRELLIELSKIEHELGDDITDPDILHILEHGGVVEGAIKLFNSAIDRVYSMQNVFSPESLKETDDLDAENIIEEQIKDDHKEEDLVESLDDPLQPPHEPTNSPSLPSPHNHQWILNPANRCKRDKTEFLILIKTNEESYVIRQAIRIGIANILIQKWYTLVN